MLINNWYVAAMSEDVSAEKPLGVRMLGVDFVLFRNPAGQVVCLSGVCCHRGAALGDGKINDGCVACPYHGWEYDETGRCVKVPAFEDPGKTPARARLDRYPVEEKYGWVWTFLGDLDESERPSIPDLFPEYDDPDHWRIVSYSLEADVNWVRMEENSLDTVHTSFVHRRFGGEVDPASANMPIEKTQWGARVAREKNAPRTSQKSAEMAKLVGERKRTKVSLEFSLIGLCHRINPTFRPGMSQVQFTARTPIDAYRTRVFGWQARNYMMEPEQDADRLAGITEALQEDLSVVTRVQPPLTPKRLPDEFLTGADGMEGAFRALVKEMGERGWEIDIEAMEAEQRYRAMVIPSPGRRKNPRNWVQQPVPLRPAKGPQAVPASNPRGVES